MKFIIVLVAAVGLVTSSPQGFLQNTPEVEAANINFFNEFNRLAKLAADAPDIHIYTDDAGLQLVEAAPTQLQPQQQKQPQLPSPLQGFNIYSFTSNLGTNSQFQPTQIQRSFQQTPQLRQTVHTPEQQTQQQQHKQVFRPAQSAVHEVEPAPVQRWTGPLAHTVPAGLNGAPTQVGFTPEVEEARNSHFRVLVNAYQEAAAVAAAAEASAPHARQQ